MPLGMEVDIGPSGDSVLDGDPAPPRKGHSCHSSPLFAAHVYCSHGRPSQLLLSSCFEYSALSIGIRNTPLVNKVMWRKSSIKISRFSLLKINIIVYVLCTDTVR